MSFLEWDESLRIGLGLIDEQHQKMIEAINRLHAAVKSGADRQTVSDCGEELVSLSRHHYLAEEKLLRRIHYPAVLEHQNEHNRQAEWAIRAQLAFEHNPEAQLSMQSMEQIRAGFLHHVCVEDRAWSNHLRQYLLDHPTSKIAH